LQHLRHGIFQIVGPAFTFQVLLLLSLPWYKKISTKYNNRSLPTKIQFLFNAAYFPRKELLKIVPIFDYE